MLSMIDSAVAGSRAVPAGAARRVSGVRARRAGLSRPSRELLEKLAVPIPNEHTDRLDGKAREHDIYIQSGSMLEVDPRWPGVVFNTTCLIGPEGILYKYRKVNPWIPYEVHASPHDLAGYDEPLFPVADTPIGRLGCAICYDWLFPEAIRQLAANGAEVLIRVSAYMDPVGRDRADELVDDRQPLPRAREHGVRGGRQPGREPAALSAVLVAGRQPDRRLRRTHARRSLARSRRADRRRARSTSPRCATSARRGSGHHMLAHLRTEAYPVYRRHATRPRATSTKRADDAELDGQQRTHRPGETGCRGAHRAHQPSSRLGTQSDDH